MSNNKAGLIHYSCFRFLKYFYVIIIFSHKLGFYFVL